MFTAHYFSWSPLYTLSNASLPFCAGVQFSSDPIPTLNDRIKIQKKEVCEQFTIYSMEDILRRVFILPIFLIIHVKFDAMTIDVAGKIMHTNKREMRRKINGN